LPVLKFKTVLLHLIISTKQANAMQKRKVAMQVVNYYARLYKAQNSRVTKENQKTPSNG
jgi:hypothetical protein